jgi:outer membrane receptor for ferric coprogen and ferric-rhodotorulic acid
VSTRTRRVCCGFAVHPAAWAARLFLAACAAGPVASQAQGELAPVTVKARPDFATEGTGSYTARSASTATRLDLSLRETPQSITVVPRSFMDDFLLDDVTGLLSRVTGVNVERVETDRTYYSVRGFQVTNFQVDGIGLPFATGDQIGNLDTALYDRVEILRGANGLQSLTGNPAATVNFVRKRPTEELRASAGLTLGSWNRRRLDFDVSGPLNAAHTVRARLVGATEDGDSYLDRYSLQKHVLGGVVEMDLGPRTLLTLGHGSQRNRPRGVMWGALPIHYADGTPVDYPASANAAPGWTYWNTGDSQTFAELRHQFANDWEAKATLTKRNVMSDAELFYLVGAADRTTGTGLLSWPSRYSHTERQWIADAHLRGPFSLGGRTHELVFGVNAARSNNRLHSSDDDLMVPLTEAEMLSGAFPRPDFDQGVTGYGHFRNRQTSLYAAARLRPTDRLQLIAGASVTRATSSGVQYGVVHEYAQTKPAPYLGATWQLAPAYSLYASYGRIFSPQHQTDLAGAVLAPIEGYNAEVGAKGEWFGGRLNGSIALFRTKQANTAEAGGFVTTPEGGRTWYRGVDATATGFEIDVAGQLAPGWEASGGYTQLRIEGPDGASVRTYVPRRTFKIATTYRLPSLPALKVGAGLRWQSATERTDGNVVTKQGAYGLLDLVASYEVNKHLSLTGKVENATDKKHLNSLLWPSQTYYGAPRSYSVAMKWTY